MPITTTTERNVGTPGHTTRPDGDPAVATRLLRCQKMERALLKFVEVEKMFGHTGQHDPAECADCARVIDAREALDWRDEAPN